jgi:glutathione peroxidase
VFSVSIYNIEVKSNLGAETSLKKYEGNVLLIVNTASECGFTPQYNNLQELYEKYRDKGFLVLAFPSNQFGGQEPGTDEEIQQFCDINYKVTFPIFSKIEVNGEGAHPLFQYLKQEAPDQSDIKWNFTKFLVDSKGNVVQRYESKTVPEDISQDIEALL